MVKAAKALQLGFHRVPERIDEQELNRKCVGVCLLWLVIILSFWLAIVDPPFFLFVLSICGIVYLSYLVGKDTAEKRKLKKAELAERRRQKEAELAERGRQKEAELRERERANKRGQLITSGNCNYVQKYVSTYKNSPYDSEKVIKLKDLIVFKSGILLDYNDVIWLIKKEEALQNYEDFKTKLRKRLLYSKPKTVKELTKEFLDMYGENHYRYISFFESFLKESGFPASKGQITQQIDEVMREMELSRFEKKLESRGVYSLSVNDLDSMTGYEFEEFLKTLFEKMGHHVEQTKLSSDQGADLVISKFGEKTVVQAKRYSNKVPNKAIQEVVASIPHYKADQGMVVTTSEFTRSAIELAHSNNVELIDGHELDKLIQRFM